MTPGTVIIVPGPFCTELDGVDSFGTRRIWPNPLALAEGRFADLILPTPTHIQKIQVGSIIPGYYDVLSHALKTGGGYNVVPFPYDWRLDVEVVAASLTALIAGSSPPVRIIAHSLGGTIARKALQSLLAQLGHHEAASLFRGLVLLGPAPQGTLAAAVLLSAATQHLPVFDALPGCPNYVQPTMRTFPALYQALPWDSAKLPSLDDPDFNIRSLGFWRDTVDSDMLLKFLPPGQTPWAAKIDTSAFTSRTTIILGDAPHTAGGVCFRNGRLVVESQYDVPGDGFVSRACSLLDDHPATYIVSGVGHLRLPLARVVIEGILDIFAGKVPSSLVSYHQ